jgi:hypothetical protein
METLAGKPDVTWWLLKLLTAKLQLVEEEALLVVMLPN